jgi:hypothetical protein
MKNPLLILICVCFINAVSGQIFDSSLLIPAKLLAHTNYTAYALAYKYTKSGDSINASSYLLEVDPYYPMMVYDVTPDSLDAFLSTLLLTAQARQAFKDSFTKVYSAPRTEAYKDFKTMATEDQAIRRKLNDCGDSISCSIYEQRMRVSDSIHFTYLYNYVVKNGWPSIENGAVYAQILAIHDHAHFDYYIPIIRKAVLAGLVRESTYYLMLSYKERENTPIKHYLKVPNKVVIDVNSVVDGILPDEKTIEKIKTEAKLHCPLKCIIFVYESNNEDDADNWWKTKRSRILDDIAVIIDCPTADNSLYTDHEIISGRKKKMKLYLIY